MYQFKMPQGKHQHSAQGQQRRNSSSRGSASDLAAAPPPAEDSASSLHASQVHSLPNSNHRGQRHAAPHVRPSEDRGQSLQRRAESDGRSVASDMAAWKESMRAERQQRLTQSQQKHVPSRARQPLQSRHQERPEAPPPTSLSLSEYREAVLATRSAADVISNTHVSRSASQASASRHRAAATTHAHAGPISIPHKRIDPLDVQFRPARSVVRQFMLEPTPYFVRKNSYGTLDGYVDQAASASYRLQDAAAASPAYHREVSFSRDEPPLRDIKERPAAWRQNVSSKLYDFPTPRSTLLRNSYISERHFRPAPSPRPRSASVGDASPRFSLAHQHRDHAKLSARDRRLMGAPSPQEQRIVPQSVSDRLISPHHNGSHNLPVRRDPPSSGRGRGDDASLDMDLDPVPLSFAPSPVSRQQREAALHAPSAVVGGRRAVLEDDESPQQRQSMGKQQAAEHPAANSYQPAAAASSWSPVGGRSAHQAFASPQSPPEERDAEPSPGVDVSPPTPSQPPRQGYSPVASPPQHRGAVEASTGGRRAPAAATRPVAPVQNLLQQLALPTMRTQRNDLFQGHSAAAAARHQPDPETPEDGVPSVANLRHSARHDKLERELMESQRKAQYHNDPYSAQPRNRWDPLMMSESSPDGLSSSRVLLQQLATKRVPR